MSTAFIKEVGPFRWAYRTAVRQFYKRVLKRAHRMRLPTGELFTLPVVNQHASEVFVTKANIDWGSERLLYEIFPQGGVFLDVGAHIGYYAAYMRPKASKIYCFEPDPRVIADLKLNTNAQIHTTAVGAKSGKSCFTLTSAMATSHLSDEGLEVTVTTVDDFAATLEHKIDAIKTDLEGSDLDALRGAVKTLIGQRPVVLSEISPTTELFDLMRAVSYRVFAYYDAGASFGELSANISKHTKMLFLVPQERASELILSASRLDAS